MTSVVMASRKRKADVSLMSKRLCVTRLHVVERKVCQIWRICGFGLSIRESIQVLESTKFNIRGSDIDWKMKLNTTQAEDDIKLTLQSSISKPIPINVEYSVISVSGEKKNVHRLAGQHMGSHSIHKFLTWSELMKQKSHLLPNDELTISCVLDISTSVQMQNEQAVKLPQKDPKDSSRANSLYSDLKAFHEQKKSTDVLLKVGETEIPAHKAILACRSPVFASMFEHDMKEKNSNEVIISDVEGDVFKELVRFVYTDEILQHDMDFLLKLMVTADKYDVRSLKTRCVECIRAELSAENIFEILRVSVYCRVAELVQACIDIVAEELSPTVLKHNWIAKLKDCPGLLDVIEISLKERFDLS